MQPAATACGAVLAKVLSPRRALALVCAGAAAGLAAGAPTELAFLCLVGFCVQQLVN